MSYLNKRGKKTVGLIVGFRNYRSPMQFPEGYNWDWGVVNDRRTLIIENEQGEVMCHINQEDVMYVGGPTTLIRDGDAK